MVEISTLCGHETTITKRAKDAGGGLGKSTRGITLGGIYALMSDVRFVVLVTRFVPEPVEYHNQLRAEEPEAPTARAARQLGRFLGHRPSFREKGGLLQVERLVL